MIQSGNTKKIKKVNIFKMKDNIILKSYEVLNDMILLKWDDETESFLHLKKMRENCPCANCAGEKDVFGNIYKGPKQVITETAMYLMGCNL